MDPSASVGMQSGNITRDSLISNHPPRSFKTYFFTVATISAIVFLALGGIGVAGYFHVGVLSNMAQIDAIVMMALYGGAGAVLLIVGIVGLIKNRNATHIHRTETHIRNRDALPAETSNHQMYHSTGTNYVRQTDFIEKTGTGAIRGLQHFGKAQWEFYFGAVGNEPPLPSNIHEILDSPCPFSGDKTIKVKDTHMLVLIPASVNGEALTLNKLAELIKKPKNGGHPTKYGRYNMDQKREHGDKTVDRAHWVLMTRDVIPESKAYNEENEFIRQRAAAIPSALDTKELIRQRAGGEYDIPSALEAAVCILMEHVFSGKKLFSGRPLPYMSCSETVANSFNVVVGFGPRGFEIGTLVFRRVGGFRKGEPQPGCLDVAALRRF
jgi:hypothetical protein